MPEREIRYSKGDGSKENPYTFTPGSTAMDVIKEGAKFSWKNCLENNEYIHFEINTASFLIRRSNYDSKKAIFIAEWTDKENSANTTIRDLTLWGSYASSIFTLTALSANFWELSAMFDHLS
ncbi:MAG TPA: hypothetical protein VG895_04335 [Patescibacteria group bacterium]|nr:hypothetical protein [Patescibacteria group bacterium]